MIVYVEYVFIDNFIIDFILFYCVAKILHLKISFFRFAFALILGTTFAFVTPLLHLDNTLIFIFKLLCGIVLVATAFKIQRFSKFLIGYLLFIFLTFLLGGICLGLQSFFTQPTAINGAFTYSSQFPVSLLFLAVFVFYVIGKNLLSYLKVKKRNVNLQVCFMGKNFVFNALIDSGNQLIDNETKLAVTFLSEKIFKQNFEFNLKENPTCKKFACRTVAGSKIVDTFVVDKILLDKKITILNARVALLNINEKQDYNAIVSSNLMI